MYMKNIELCDYACTNQFHNKRRLLHSSCFLCLMRNLATCGLLTSMMENPQGDTLCYQNLFREHAMSNPLLFLLIGTSFKNLG
ncbi:hypothetical protein LOK49_LG01G01196 [Camellia lanceoleosa]|uniref:Uncharacterized protein n=1 Tax=Camellia lanceoleosa TaxID=1840588 RepID=A0ACC0IZ30_9ERIC|nr:hypothetical protein LOK49_LG01G01196 [Camellia lanceoleosa]